MNNKNYIGKIKMFEEIEKDNPNTEKLAWFFDYKGNTYGDFMEFNKEESDFNEINVEDLRESLARMFEQMMDTLDYLENEHENDDDIDKKWRWARFTEENWITKKDKDDMVKKLIEKQVKDIEKKKKEKKK